MVHSDDYNDLLYELKETKRHNNQLIEQLDALALQRNKAEDFIRRTRRVLLDYVDSHGRHCGSCCTMVDGKVVITDESCVCGSTSKLARKLLEETLGYAVEGERPCSK